MSDATRRRSADSLAAEARFRARLSELGAVLLEPGWISKKKPHHVRCAVGHDCYPLPANVNRGNGICRACAGCDPATAERMFCARIAELGATVIGEYRDNRTRVHVRCPAAHDCYPLPGKVRQGAGICPVCRGSDPAAAEAAFRAALAGLGAILLEPEWLGSRSRHRAICAAGHECAAVPGSIKRGQGICRACAGRDPAVAEAAFRAKVAKLGGAVLGECRGAHVKVHVRCVAGHDCYPTPHSVQRGCGICRTCAGMDPAACEAKFRARLAEVGATPLYPAWLGSGQPHAARCAAGHDCQPRPGDVLRGCGICRTCRGSLWNAFYVVTSSTAVKFGITSGDPRPRLRAHFRCGFTSVVRLLTDLPGTMALDAERAARAALADAGALPLQGREYFDISCLALVLDVADGWIGIPPA